MGLESYLKWLRTFETLNVDNAAGGCVVHSTSNAVIEGVVLKIPVGRSGWKRLPLAPWAGSIKVTY